MIKKILTSILFGLTKMFTSFSISLLLKKPLSMTFYFGAVGDKEDCKLSAGYFPDL